MNVFLPLVTVPTLSVNVPTVGRNVSAASVNVALPSVSVLTGPVNVSAGLVNVFAALVNVSFYFYNGSTRVAEPRACKHKAFLSGRGERAAFENVVALRQHIGEDRGRKNKDAICGYSCRATGTASF